MNLFELIYQFPTIEPNSLWIFGKETVCNRDPLNMMDKWIKVVKQIISNNCLETSCHMNSFGSKDYQYAARIKLQYTKYSSPTKRL